MEPGHIGTLEEVEPLYKGHWDIGKQFRGNIHILVAVLLCIAIRVNVVESRSGGAPAEACETLSPDPGSHLAQPQSSLCGEYFIPL